MFGLLSRKFLSVGTNCFHNKLTLYSQLVSHTSDTRSCQCSLYNFTLFLLIGARGGVVVKALRYKPAGRGFDSRCFHWNFSVT